MEQIIEPLSTLELMPVNQSSGTSNGQPFIEANTIAATVQEIKDHHTIPVFIKDNEPLISHGDFIETIRDIAADTFHGEHILQPAVRVSHPIKGRIPSAKDKPASMLREDEKTLFYERMMFVIEVPSIQACIGGNILSLMIGGVKSYGEDNLYQKSGADQHFKLFIGFQNKVCTNMCVSTDGAIANLKVRSLQELQIAAQALFQRYQASKHLEAMQMLNDSRLTEHQFATLVGRCRMYAHLPANERQLIPALQFGEQQITSLVRQYYTDTNFARDYDGSIGLWRLYNLFTGVNKSSYLDSFLSRSVNATQFIESLATTLQTGGTSWYLQ